MNEALETGSIYNNKTRHTMHTGQVQTRGVGKLVYIIFEYQLQSSEC